MSETPTRTIIEPSRGWVPIDLRELVRQRELLVFLAWRDIVVRYKQTLLGAMWAILQPGLMMVVFTVIGKLAAVDTEGANAFVFSLSGVLVWNYFQNATLKAGNSLVGNERLVTKIYFPRVFLPMAPAIASVLDYTIGLSLLVVVMVVSRAPVDAEIVLLPLFVLSAALTAVGVGMWLSALNVKYRDVRFLMPFLLQLWMFVTPVIYAPDFFGEYAWLLSLNPMGGIVDAHRAAILTTKAVDWSYYGTSLAIAAALFVGGAYYFKRMERTFADVI